MKEDSKDLVAQTTEKEDFNTGKTENVESKDVLETTEVKDDKTSTQSEVKTESAADRILREYARRKQEIEESKQSLISQKAVLKKVSAPKEDVKPTKEVEVATDETTENSTELPKKDVTERVDLVTDKITETVDETTENSTELPKKDVTESADLITDKITETVDETSSDATQEEVAEDDVKEPKPTTDYTTFSRSELVDKLTELVENEPVQKIRSDVENIKTNFYKQLNVEVKEKKRQFVEAQKDNDVIEAYVPEPDELEQKVKEVIKNFRAKRVELNNSIERDKQTNLQRKYEVIEKIKALVNNKESINETFSMFHKLQEQWRELGLVPQTELKNLWENYHHHVEKFYDFIKINKELRDLDLKKNLEEKIILCEKAEELLLESSIVKAFKTLQHYHEQWREIGPVPREKKDEIWERFKLTTSKINKTHQDYFEKLKDERENNLKAKTLLCEKAEEIASEEIDEHKGWEEKSKELIELQKVWKLIGYVPHKFNNEIYQRFRAACDKFFVKKRDFYTKIKDVQTNNLQEKTELCIQAEGLKESTEWKKTSDEFISLQKHWKTIGPVPRKYSDSIWKRFRAACGYFFDKKKEYYSTINETQNENLRLKNEVIEKIKNFEFGEINADNMKMLKQFQKEWTEIGHVPFEQKDKIQKEYRKVINKRFEGFDLNEVRNSEMDFKSKMQNIQQSGKVKGKFRAEREKIQIKLSKVENDITLWENNIGFFAKSKNAESMIRDMHRKIDDAKDLAKSLKDKLKMMDKMETETQA